MSEREVQRGTCKEYLTLSNIGDDYILFKIYEIKNNIINYCKKNIIRAQNNLNPTIQKKQKKKESEESS